MHPGRRTWLAIALGAVVLAIAFGMMRSRGPRFQDRAAREWFPRWERIDSAEGLEVERFNALTTGGPAVMPVLEAALSTKDTPFARSLAAGYRWFQWGGKGSGTRWREATELQDAAFGALVVILQQEDCRRAFTNRADHLPGWVLQATCEHLVAPRHLQSISEPHLLRLLASTNAHLAAAAGIALLDFPTILSSRAGEVLQRLAGLAPAAYLDPAPRPAVPRPLLAAFRLMPLHPPPPVARDWMRSWLDATNPPLLILCASVTLGAWDPAGFPIADHLAPILHPGLPATADLEGYFLALAGPHAAPLHPQIGTLARLVAEHRIAGLLAPPLPRGGRAPPLSPVTLASRNVALRWLASLRDKAIPAVPHLLPLLAHPEPQVAAAVAATLERITNAPAPP